MQSKLIDGRPVKLELAKKSSKELPEVHIAIATYLSVTEPSLYKKEKGALKRSGLVPYPAGNVVRAAEALSEIDWSRQQLKGLGGGYPYRAPGIEHKADALEKKLKAFYPFAVKFHAEPKAVLNIENTGSAEITVELVGRAWKKKATVAPGATSSVTLKNPGFVDLSYGGKTATYLAEPYTEVGLKL